MTQPKIQLTTFSSTTDIANYWLVLCKAETEYHIDDDPMDCLYYTGMAKEFEAELSIICQNHKALWSFARANNIDPWTYIDLSIAFGNSQIWQEAGIY